MLATLTFLLAAQLPSPLTDFINLMKRANSVSFSFTAKHSGAPVAGVGTYIFKKPYHTAFKVRWAGSNFEYLNTFERVLEIEHASKTYVEDWPYHERMDPGTELSRAPEFVFPRVYLFGDARVGVGAEGKWKSLPNEGNLRVVAGSGAGGDGFPKAKAWIDTGGRLVKYFEEHRGMSPYSVMFEFKDIRIDQALPANAFSKTAPLGYTAERLPFEPYPVQPGTKFPLVGISDLSGKSVALRRDKPTFVIVVGENCLPSIEAYRTIRMQGVNSVAIMLSGKAPTFLLPGGPMVSWKMDKAFSRLGLQGTPTVFLLDKAGMVSRVWYGFGGSQSGGVVAEMRAAYSELLK